MSSAEQAKEMFDLTLGYHRFTSELPADLLARRLTNEPVQLCLNDMPISGVESYNAVSRPITSPDGIRRLHMSADIYLTEETFGIHEDYLLTVLHKKLDEVAKDETLAAELGLDVYPTGESNLWMIYNREADQSVFVRSNAERGSLVISNQYLEPTKSQIHTPAPAIEDIPPLSIATNFLRVYTFVLDEIAKNYHILVPPRVERIGRLPLLKMEAPTQEIPIHSLSKRSAFEAIGGLTHEKAELQRLVTAYQHPELARAWNMDLPNTILLYGVSGTGKTSLARAVAEDLSAHLIEVDNTEVIDMYVGNSAKAIKAKFQEAKDHNGAVVMLLDEVDGIVPSHDTTASHDRQVLKVFKTELEDIAQNYPHVLIIATTNLPDMDPAITRRFALQFNVGKPNAIDRTEILTNLVFATTLARGTPELQGDDFKDADTLSDRDKEVPTVFTSDIDVLQLAAASEDLTGADLTDIFKQVRFRKAMEEHTTGSFRPINQYDMLTAIQEFKRSRSR